MYKELKGSDVYEGFINMGTTVTHARIKSNKLLELNKLVFVKFMFCHEKKKLSYKLSSVNEHFVMFHYSSLEK